MIMIQSTFSKKKSNQQMSHNLFVSLCLSLSDHPNQCVVPSTGKIHDVGSEWQMDGDECGEIRCEQWSGQQYLSYAR